MSSGGDGLCLNKALSETSPAGGAVCWNVMSRTREARRPRTRGSERCHLFRKVLSSQDDVGHKQGKLGIQNNHSGLISR